MGIENATTIAGLNSAWPLGTDSKNEGDNHLRLIKSVLKNDAASMSGGNVFKGQQTINSDAPYLHYIEADVAANIGYWSAGINGGTYSIVPRDGAGTVLSAGGRFEMTRDAGGVLAYVLTTQAAGSVRLAEFEGGSIVATRPAYGVSRINSTATGFLAGGAAQTSLINFFGAQDSAAATVFRVAAPSGDVLNKNNSYGGISDARLKTDITDAGPQLGDVLALRVVNYVLADDPEALKQIGLIAQEVREVKPGLVTEDPETGSLGIKYSVLVPILLKAVQELAARVEALE